MRIYTTVRTDTRVLDQLIKMGPVAAESAVAEMADRVDEIAASLSRVDTGAMRAGWAWRWYARGVRATAYVYNSVKYTIYNEFGTWKMSAQPMLGPALRYVRQQMPLVIGNHLLAGSGVGKYASMVGSWMGNAISKFGMYVKG